jgi:ubiquinone biosynthesis monooxygenase Coq7
LLSRGVYAVAETHAACRYPQKDGVSELPPHRLPGDPSPATAIARMLRVDHAGEYGATRIYEGQLDVLGRGRATGVIRRMAETEKRHLARFETLLRERRIRPTLLHPIWSVAGYTLGAATALLGERAAMACTVAVEEVIDEHYREQAERLVGEDPALRETILSFRDDEIAHRDLAIAHGAEETLGYDLINAVVKTGSRIAIWLSTRL